MLTKRQMIEGKKKERKILTIIHRVFFLFISRVGLCNTVFTVVSFLRLGLMDLSLEAMLQQVTNSFFFMVQQIFFLRKGRKDFFISYKKKLFSRTVYKHSVSFRSRSASFYPLSRILPTF